MAVLALTLLLLFTLDCHAPLDRYELVQVRYYRAEKDRVDRVHLMWPDTQMLMQDDATWSQLQTVLKAQLEAKIAVVEALSVKDEEPKPAAEVSSAPPPTESTAPKEVAGAATPAETSSATEKTDIANSKESSVLFSRWVVGSLNIRVTMPQRQFVGLGAR